MNEPGSGVCPECGAAFIDGHDCFWTLGALGEWEFAFPDLMELHFFTVASYNLQHPSRYTKRALRGLYELYRRAADENLPPATVRAYAKKQNEEKYKVTVPERDRKVVPYKWRMTISDIYVPDLKETTALRVKDWVKTVRDDIESGDYATLFL